MYDVVVAVAIADRDPQQVTARALSQKASPFGEAFVVCAWLALALTTIANRMTLHSKDSMEGFCAHISGAGASANVPSAVVTGSEKLLKLTDPKQSVPYCLLGT